MLQMSDSLLYFYPDKNTGAQYGIEPQHVDIIEFLELNNKTNMITAINHYIFKL